MVVAPSESSYCLAASRSESPSGLLHHSIVSHWGRWTCCGANLWDVHLSDGGRPILVGGEFRVLVITTQGVLPVVPTSEVTYFFPKYLTLIFLVDKYNFKPIRFKAKWHIDFQEIDTYFSLDGFGLKVYALSLIVPSTKACAHTYFIRRNKRILCLP